MTKKRGARWLHLRKFCAASIILSVKPLTTSFHIEEEISMADLRMTRRGRPQKHWHVRDAASLTSEQERTQAARELYESGGYSLNKVANKFGFTSGTISYVARLQHWRRPEPCPEPEPLIGRQVSSADVIAVLTLPVAPTKGAASVEHLPDWTSEEKARLRVTPEAVAIDLVAQIERHEALLLRYSHLVEVYLEPDGFFYDTGLTEDQQAEKVAAIRTAALRMLLPTGRETLAGVMKTLTDALRCMIELKRTVVGLGKVAAIGSQLANPRNPVGRDGGQAKNVDLEDMSIEDLQTIRRAIELLKPRHQRNREPPMPPRPESIDDLLRPEASHDA